MASKTPSKILVRALSDKTDGWHYVDATPTGPLTYVIISTQPDDAHWEFTTDDEVLCEEKVLSTGDLGLVAVQKVPATASILRLLRCASNSDTAIRHVETLVLHEQLLSTNEKLSDSTRKLVESAHPDRGASDPGYWSSLPLSELISLEVLFDLLKSIVHNTSDEEAAETFRRLGDGVAVAVIERQQD